MTDYTKTTNFAAKDSLPSGNSGKIVKGSEIDTEFNNIATAVATKANIAAPTLTGTVTLTGVLDVTDTTDSSDATGDTGALRVEGGASIAKKLFVGTDLDVDGTANLDIVDIDGAVNMASTLTIATSSDSDALIVGKSGGANLHVFSNDSALLMTNASSAGSGRDGFQITNGSVLTEIDTVAKISVSASEVSINDPSADTDFRVESDARTHMFYVDSTNSKIGVGTNSPGCATGGIHLVHDATEGTPTFGGGEVAVFQRNFNSAQGGSIAIVSGTAANSVIKFGDKDDVDIGQIDYDNADNSMRFITNTSEATRILSDGTFLVGKTADDNTVGFKTNTSSTYMVASGQTPAFINRLSDDGDILEFRKDSTTVGNIVSRSGVVSSFVFDPRSNGSGLSGGTQQIQPANENGAVVDNSIDIGSSSTRFRHVFATDGTINTSDRNEKQDIEELSDAEKRVAVAAKGLMKKYRWKSAVAEKGDDARIHVGIIAQDLQDAFTAEGLDAGRYAMFCSDTWTNDDGSEQTRLGVRYNELLAFIITSI